MAVKARPARLKPKGTPIDPNNSNTRLNMVFIIAGLVIGLVMMARLLYDALGFSTP